MDTSTDTDFFYTNGTLPLNNPSYVKRPADEELLKLVQQGHICYVLTTRQMGKSSLMARTAQQLEKMGLNVAKIDLTSMGANITIDQWYFGLLDRLQDELDLDVDLDEWWERHPLLSHVQRFTNFIRDKVLKKKHGKVVIFIDEIDTTLNFDFRDDFFAAIRSMHNAGATQPEFKRLTFVLLGTAWVPDLIKDTTRTPFNVGKGIELKEFSLPQANVLQKELETIYPTQGEAIFKRIYYWTSGHPYLTQTLCLTVAKDRDKNWSDKQIDALVEQLFFSETAKKDSNLKFVQDRILNSSEPPQLLKLYQQVYQGQIIKDDPQSIIQNQLKLSGLVKAEVRLKKVGKPHILKIFSSLWPNSEPQQASNGSSGADKPMYLAVRNRIYRRVFDLQWVKEHTQHDWGRIIAFATVIMAFLAIGLAGYVLWHDTIDVPYQAEKAELNFYQAKTPQERATSLATLFESDGILSPINYDEKAQNLFYQLEREEQLSLFKPYEVSESDLTTIVRGLYVTLADVDNTNSNEPLLREMIYALKHAHTPQTNALKEELTHWLDGREQFKNQAFDKALAPYSTAIALNGDNSATLYERARVWITSSRYPEALTDMDQVIVIAKRAPTPTAIPTSTNTPTPLPTPTNTPTALPAATKTPNVPSSPTNNSTAQNPAVTEPALSTATREATLTQVSVPTQTTIPTLTATPTATGTSTVVPVEQAPFTSQFVTTIDRINAVEKLIDNNQALALFLAGATSGASDLYSNLQEFGLVRTPTLTPSPALTSSPILTPSATLTPPVVIASVIQRIRDRGNVLIAGVKYDFPPFGELKDNGEVVGFDVDLIQAMADEWGVEVEFVQVTSKNRIEKLATSEIDIVVASMTHKKERDETIDFSQTYFLDGQSLLVKKESGIEGVKSLNDKTVAAIVGSTSIDQIQARADVNDVNIKEVIPFTEYPPALEALKAGQVDALTTDSVALSQFAKDNSELAVVGGLFTEEPYGMGLPAGDSYFNDLVNFTLQNLKEDGTYDQLYKKWFGEESIPYPVEILPGEWPYTFADSPTDLDKAVQSRVDEKLLSGECGFVAGVKYDFSPFGFVDDSGQVVGFDVDIVEEFAKRWCGDENKVELVQVTSSTRIERLANGDIDIVAASMTHKKERDEIIDFSQTYFFDGQSLLVRKDSRIADVADLDGKTVAAIQGSTSIENIQSISVLLSITIDVVPFLEYPPALEALKNGSVDTLTTDSVALLQFVKESPELIVVGGPFTSEPYGLGLPNYDDRLRDLVNFTLQEMKVDGTYDRLYQKWFGSNSNPYTVEIWPGQSYLPVNMVPMLRIPAGEFVRGRDDGLPNEGPERVIYLDEFYIDQYEVSNRLYTQCVRADFCNEPRLSSSTSFDDYYASPAFGNYPVVWVTWEDAQTYCGFAGKRLPTEAEWEKAARGPTGFIYPWGNEQPIPALANFNFSSKDTLPVGSHPAGISLYGVHDMAGNVREWVADWYQRDYYENGQLENSQGPDSGTTKVVRGGAWNDTNKLDVTIKRRKDFSPDVFDGNLGFRCASSTFPPSP